MEGQIPKAIRATAHSNKKYSSKQQLKKRREMDEWTGTKKVEGS
jgi:hypothetical protein